jgi:hypothetical protein
MNNSSQPAPPVKQGAAIGGWCCFGIGLAIMYFSVWTFFIYVPFFFVSFILAITAMAQRRIASGIVLMLALLIVPGVTWLVLSTTRLNSFILDVDRKLADAEAVGMDRIRIIPAVGSSAPPPSDTTQHPAQTPRAEPGPDSLNAQSAPQLRPVEPPDGTATVAAAPRNPNESWFRVPPDSLESLHAWELRIGPSRLFADQAITLNMPPAFSPDATLVAMLRKVNFAPSQVLLVRLDNHQIVQSWTPSSPPLHIAWSQDGKRLAYVMRQEDVFAVFDRDKGAEIRVPLPTKLSFDSKGLAWDGDTRLIHRARGRLESINLDNLKIDRLLQDDAADELVEQMWEQFLAKNGPRHPHAFLQVSQDLLERTTDIFVVERDKAFRKALFNFGSAPGGVHVHFSRDLRHAIFNVKDGLMHALMVRSEPSLLSFDLNLAIRETVGQNNWPSIKEHLESGRPVWGRVYGPLINPLNGKVTGADRKNFRGVVQFIRWTAAKAGVQTVTEILPIRVGDVVVEIDHQRMGLSTALGSALKDRWFALQTPSGHKAVELPADARPTPDGGVRTADAAPAAAQPAVSSQARTSPTEQNHEPAQQAPKRRISPREMSSEEFLRKAKSLQKR